MKREVKILTRMIKYFSTLTQNELCVRLSSTCFGKFVVSNFTKEKVIFLLCVAYGSNLHGLRKCFNCVFERYQDSPIYLNYFYQCEVLVVGCARDWPVYVLNPNNQRDVRLWEVMSQGAFQLEDTMIPTGSFMISTFRYIDYHQDCHDRMEYHRDNWYNVEDTNRYFTMKDEEEMFKCMRVNLGEKLAMCRIDRHGVRLDQLYIHKSNLRIPCTSGWLHIGCNQFIDQPVTADPLLWHIETCERFLPRFLNQAIGWNDCAYLNHFFCLQSIKYRFNLGTLYLNLEERVTFIKEIASLMNMDYSYYQSLKRVSHFDIFDIIRTVEQKSEIFTPDTIGYPLVLRYDPYGGTEREKDFLIRLRTLCVRLSVLFIRNH